MQFVSSRIQMPARPADMFRSNRSSALHIAGLLGSPVFEDIAEEFVRVSRRPNVWQAFVFTHRYNLNDGYKAMVEVGLLREIEVDKGWSYELTLEAVCKLVAGPPPASAYAKYSRHWAPTMQSAQVGATA